MRQTNQLPVTEESHVGEVRRKAASLGADLELSEDKAGKLAIVVTELAGNIVKHAGSGDILLRAVEESGNLGIEVLALDKGPGMANVAACMRDGYSTSGTPGTGLGAASRLSDEFDIQSTPGIGTAAYARIWTQSRKISGNKAALQYGVVCIPKPREEVCGDSWGFAQLENHAILSVMDGLGHGPDAAAASNLAIRTLYADQSVNPVHMLESIHVVLRATRGAAGAIASLNMVTGEITFAGVGNIVGAIMEGAGQRHMVSHNGTLGHVSPRISAFTYPSAPTTTVVMHSDGLATQWRLDMYPGLLMKHPSLIAGVLYRDFKRGTDDATVLVVRRNAVS